MKKVKLERMDAHLREELKDEKFRKLYEFERTKVALAQKIAQIREENCLKQAEVARKLGVSQQFISQIETGQERNLTLGTLLRLANTLGRGVKISFPRLSKRSSRTLQVA